MSPDSDIIAISAAWDAALIRNDAEAVAAFMADDWVYVDTNGAVPKADIINWIASGQLAHHTMETIGQPRVAVHGDSATVTARKQSTGSWDGAAYTADEWITEVFIHQADGWLCTLSHKCPASTVPE